MVNRSVTLTKKINLDLGVETNQTQVLNAIKGLNSLTNDEKNAIELVTKIGLITKDGLAIKVKLHNLTSKIVTFTVKRELTTTEVNDDDIQSIKTILNAKDGDDLIIVLPSDSTDNIIANNKDKITKKLRKKVTKDNVGAIVNPLMKGVTISVSMATDSPITTKSQEIIITLSKGDGTPITISKFQVKRELTTTEVNDDDIQSIKTILNAKDGDDLIIVLPSDSADNIIANNKDSIENELRKMITGDDIGAANHDSMKGVTMSVSMPTDSQITTIAQEFTIELTKSDGTPVQINKFKVKRDWTIAEKAANTSIDLIKQQLDKLVGNALIIVLPSDTTGNIVADNKDSIENELRKMITGDDIGAAKHDSMKGVTISVSMPTDSQITTTTKEIIVTLSKDVVTQVKTDVKFQVKRELTSIEKDNDDIQSIKQELDKLVGNDLTIVLPSGTTGNIIANNKDAIEEELRKKVTKDNVGAIVNSLMKGVTISVSMVTDSQITTIAQEFTIELTKSDGTPVQINKFKVKRDWTVAEKAANTSIDLIKQQLDKLVGNALTIVLPSDSTGNVIANNKDKITKELRKMITGDDIGAANHDSMKGVTISVSMVTDSPITTTAQEIIVTLSKGDGALVKTNAKFQVKREFTSAENAANNDITSIKEELDKVSVDNLTITFPSGTTGNIIANNKDAIEEELRKKVTKDNVGAIVNPLMKGVTISVSMVTDSPITTTAQEIIVTLSKGDGTPITISKFKVRKFTIAETIAHNADITSIKQELDKVPGNDLTIVLPSDSTGNVIANNEQKILKKLRKMITGDETGAANHDSMKGVTISVSMVTDSPITTTAQEIIVTLSKGDGTPITISKFQVRKFTIAKTIAHNADITSIKKELDKVPGNDLTIVLPSDSTGNVIANNEQKILKKLRKMITGDDIGAIVNPLMKGVTISVSMVTDSPITITAKEIIITLSKGDGTPITISKFQVKRELTSTEKDNADIKLIKDILDAKTGDDSIIVLSGSTRGYIISDNKDNIEKELRKMITKDSIGDPNHESMLGVTIWISSRFNNWLTKTAQEISVNLRKGTTRAQTSVKFQVKRKLSDKEVILTPILAILNAKKGDDLIIGLPTKTWDDKELVIEYVKKELRKIILNDDIGAADNPLMKGVKLAIGLEAYRVIVLPVPTEPKSFQYPFYLAMVNLVMYPLTNLNM